MPNLGAHIQELLRKKGYYDLTPEERRQRSFEVLKKLQGSFPGDPEAMIRALEEPDF